MIKTPLSIAKLADSGFNDFRIVKWDGELIADFQPNNPLPSGLRAAFNWEGLLEREAYHKTLPPTYNTGLTARAIDAMVDYARQEKAAAPPRPQPGPL